VTAVCTREAGYDRLARALLELCPLRSQRDVADYLDARKLFVDAEAVGVAALPPPGAQPALVRALLGDYPRDALVAAGIVRGQSDGLDWPQHRLVIPWRDRDGRIASLQRRTIAPLGNLPKYVFPAGGFRPRAPYGAEFFDVAAPDCEAVVVTEGALEALARRAVARRWGERVIVLAVPSASTLLDPKTWASFIDGRDVVVAFDSDNAGERAAAAFAEKICAGARSLTRERLEGAKDFGEAILAEDFTR
jgi:DNA primase